MERLTKRKLNKFDHAELNKCDHTKCDVDCCVCDVQDEANMKLKAYEDAEEQGLLHKAQLKDGTPIYVSRCDWDDDYVVHEESYIYGMTENLIGEINKDWWLTKEEAEQALKEGVKND